MSGGQGLRAVKRSAARLLGTAGLVALACASKESRSLVPIDIDGPADADISNVTVSVRQGGNELATRTLTWKGARTDTLKIGIYLPSSIKGDVIVGAVATATGGRRFGSGDPPVTAAVASGKVAGLVKLSLRPLPDMLDGASPDGPTPVARDGGSGENGDAASESGGQGGMDAAPTGITVSGRVIDIRRRPFPNLPVAIGTTPATTDAAGRFSIPNVTPPYDISLIVSGSALTEAWAFVGNTRPDPTLQLDWDVPPHLSANQVDVSFTGFAATGFATSDQASISWASADGWFSYGPLTTPGILFLSATWSGPTQSAGTIHALRWTPVSGPPTGYLGYDEKPLALNANANSETTLDLTTKSPAIAAGTISGSVTVGELASPSIVAYVAFPSGGAIPIASESVQNTFSYTVPGLANATVALVASAGTLNYPSGLILKRGLPTTDQTGVVLAIPNPVHQMFPANGGMASTQTDFTWMGQDAVYILNFNYGVEDPNRDPVINYRVVTAQKSGRFPRLPAGSGIDPMAGHRVNWWVEIQGPFATMTDATGPTGFIAPLNDSAGIAGPLDRDAIRVRSALWSVNTAAP
jgi:hypothetical protein